ncbi:MULTISPECIES: DNA polymerase III subunit gamma/tau [Terrabacteria group]|uniref:DNA polymerase III subunit gamma/tau n=1 Tax=Bacillati TaxID=1783272 RepID=UPI001C6F1722|nr:MULTISPECIES: DNA polymerase III subunit gamma/tau [Terrabacteria group]MBW9212495.1 DNA polymerase III subunit gamma/tau [Trueperella sp. zg.1013]
MGKQALYQKYRSKNFEEVIGQEYTVQAIQNTVNQDKIGHAYLFCGPRGTGKTTMARLFAKAVNCEGQKKKPCNHCKSCELANKGVHPDIIEINAANETSVDHIRDLIEKSYLAPMRSLYKVYIIDEVHQLSSAASSALLKILEEPPENVIFILATTDPQKMLATIISRCQRFDFRRVPSTLIQNHLLNVAKLEGIQLEETAAKDLARLADGGVRDALSLLDQCAAYTSNTIKAGDIQKIYGLTSVEEKITLLHLIQAKNYLDIMHHCKQYQEQGINLEKFLDEWIEVVKEIILYVNTRSKEVLGALTFEEVSKTSQLFTKQDWMNVLDVLIGFKEKFKQNKNQSIYFEVLCIQLSQLSNINEIEIVEKPVEVNEEPIVTLKEEVREELPMETKELHLTTKEIVGLLIQCNKQAKADDTEIIRLAKLKGTVEDNRIISAMDQVQLMAAGENCVLFVSEGSQLQERMMESSFHEAMYQFMRTKLSLDKMPYIFTKQEFDEAIELFKELRKNNQLPKAYEVHRYQNSHDEENQIENRLNELFGKENVTIM